MIDHPITEVCIDTPGPTITVKARGDLETVAAKAMDLFREVHELDRRKSPGPGFGLQAEREY